MAAAGAASDIREVDSILSVGATPEDPSTASSKVGSERGTAVLQPGPRKLDESLAKTENVTAAALTEPLTPDVKDLAGEAAYVSESSRRWSKLRQNFRLAALRSIAQDKREALKKLQEVRKRADKAQEAQSDSRTCKICWDRATNTVCLDCGHQCMCTRCGACMTFCPICMQDITDLVELQ